KEVRVGQSDDDKQLDRRHFLRCMAWVGTGAVWTLSSGILKGTPLGLSDGGAMMPHGSGGLRFVQISDSHIGFDKPANTDVTATLGAAVAKIKAAPEQPSFVLHTGDLTHLSKPSEFDTLQQALAELSLPVFYVPGEPDVLGLSRVGLGYRRQRTCALILETIRIGVGAQRPHPSGHAKGGGPRVVPHRHVDGVPATGARLSCLTRTNEGGSRPVEESSR